MKTRFATRLLLCFGLFGAVGAGIAVAATTNATAAKTNSPGKKAEPAVTNAPVTIQVAASKFTIPTSISEGRDPFFPNSTRFSASAVASGSNSKKPAPVSLLLQGISVVGDKRFALINGRTFAVDEDADVPAGNGKIHVRCLSMREDMVAIEADGTRRELRLRPGL